MSAHGAQPAVPAPEQTPAMRRALLPAALLAAVGLVACVAGWLLRPTDFYRGYLAAYLFWLGLPLGSLGFVLLHPLTGGRWGRPLRPVMEAAVQTLPLMAVLFLPVAVGIGSLYVWWHHQALGDHHLDHKMAYFNGDLLGWEAPGSFFFLRAALYFVIFSALAWLMIGATRRRDQGRGSPAVPPRLAGPGMVLLFLAGTFMAVDWFMSLEPLWFSSIFGLYVLVGMGLTAMSFAIVVAVLILPRPDLPHGDLHGMAAHALSAGLDRDLLHDLAKLLFMLVNLFAYVAFSQYLIIWSGNLPEEITWYTVRNDRGLRPIPVFLIIAHFALPFGVLMSRHMKRRAGVVLATAGLLLPIHLVNVWWMVLPSFRVDEALYAGGTFWAHFGGEAIGQGVTGWTLALAVAATAFIGGVLVAAIAALMAGRPPMAYEPAAWIVTPPPLAPAPLPQPAPAPPPAPGASP